jgi:hypothetical protein
MTRRALINELSSNGMLTSLLRAGLVDAKIVMYRDMLYDLDIEMKVNKLPKVAAVQAVADKWKVSHMTVYRAIKFYKL